MGQWSGNKTSKGNINGGQEYNAGDKVKTSDFNAAINNTIYASEFVDAMTAEAGSNAGVVGTPSVTFNAQTKKFTFNYLKGAKGDTGATPTIVAASGSDIATVGTPSVTASTVGTTTTFTFHNLKGQQGIQGIQGDKGDAAIVNNSAYNKINFEVSQSGDILYITVSNT